MKKILILVTAVTLSSILAAPAFAQTSVNTDVGANVTAANGVASVNATANANVQARITKGKSRADQEVDRRTTALSALTTRVQTMAKLTDSEKSTIAASIQAQISTLASLKTKIDADTDIATLKTDIQSITKSYRIFMLVIPQGRILVAADKLSVVAENGVTLATKISARIDAAAAAGKDVTSLKTTLVDMQAKLSDVTVQSNAAVSETANLTPDNGDQTLAASNTAALKDAHTKIKTGAQDIESARKDAHTIISALAALHLDAAESATTSTQ